MTSAVPGVVDMFASALGYGQGNASGSGGGGGGGVSGWVSASSSASSGPVGYTPNFGGFGGINTGTQTQGLDATTIALIAGAVLVAVLLLR